MDLPILAQVESIANRFHSLKSSVGSDEATNGAVLKGKAMVKTDLNNNEEDKVSVEEEIGESYEIRPFYEGKNIFVTGGTGFLGKVLIEKLLRSCDGIKHIYILLRPKRGLTSEQRYREFVKHPAFDRLRAKAPYVLEKMICIGGDITMPQLGLSEMDRQLLVENVNIVFHVAATVRFNEGLKEAAVLNAIGTQRILDLCVKMFHLQVGRSGDMSRTLIKPYVPSSERSPRLDRLQQSEQARSRRSGLSTDDECRLVHPVR